MSRKILLAFLSLTIWLSSGLLPAGSARAQSPSPTPTETPVPEPTDIPTPNPSPTEDPEPEPVKPRVTISLSNVELFGRALVKGTVRPRNLDVTAIVKLRRNGKTIVERNAKVRNGAYNVRLMVRAPGSYRARVVVDGPGVKRTVKHTSTKKPSLPALSQGDRGGYVRRLENRLLALGYYLPDADRRFGVETSDALIAFNKVQRSARVGYVTETTWRALAFPIRPKPRFRSAKHFEIDQTRQVILVVRKKKVRWILHTSTGAGSATRDGTFAVHRKVEGYSPGRLYYPSYFDGLRAFHGWPEVPTYNASHGCSRVPMWAARWLYRLAKIGDTVHIYH